MASTSRGGGAGGGHQDPTRREAASQLQQLMNYEDDDEESPFIVRVRVEPRRHSDYFAMSDVVVHLQFSPQIANGDMPLTEMNIALHLHSSQVLLLALIVCCSICINCF